MISERPFFEAVNYTVSKGCDYGYISWNAPGQQIAEGPTASPRQSPSLINGSRASFCSDVDISKKRGKKNQL